MVPLALFTGTKENWDSVRNSVGENADTLYQGLIPKHCRFVLTYNAASKGGEPLSGDILGGRRIRSE